MLIQAIREIYKTNLGVKRDERVLAFTDRPTKKDVLSEEEMQRWSALNDILMLIEETGRAYCKNVLSCIYPSRGGHGIEPPERLWRLAFGEKTVELLNKKGLLRKILRKSIRPEEFAAVERIIQKNRQRAVVLLLPCLIIQQVIPVSGIF